jgi:Tol biopolymer transport system component
VIFRTVMRGVARASIVLAVILAWMAPAGLAQEGAPAAADSAPAAAPPPETQPGTAPDSLDLELPTPGGYRPEPAPPREDLGPDNSYGGYDLWMTKQRGDGTWTIPVNLGGNINSTVREFSPTVSRDGKKIYFASKDRREGFGGADLYVAERDGKGWKPAVNLGKAINSKWEEMGPAPLPDGKGLIFSRKDPTQRSHDLLISVFIDGEWLDAIGIGKPLATPAEERLPSLTANGREIFFAASWRSGAGNYDLWQSYRDDQGNWSDPINLGPTINTTDSEYSPGVSPDGNRLFFASQREGMPAFDIYMTERKAGGTWQTPVRLSEPVNTPEFNEYCPSVGPDGKTLYFASDREHGTVSAPRDVE